MTWFSDRSGMASTGVCKAAQMPHRASPAPAKITSQRRRIENSMTLSIMLLWQLRQVPGRIFLHCWRAAFAAQKNGAALDDQADWDAHRSQRFTRHRTDLLSPDQLLVFWRQSRYRQGRRGCTGIAPATAARPKVTRCRGWIQT